MGSKIANLDPNRACSNRNEEVSVVVALINVAVIR